MTKSILQNGDLLFMSDESDLSKAIIETTEKYSHVGIYFDGYIYHASRKRGVAKQIFEDYLTEEKRDIYIYRYPIIDAEIVKERAERYLGCEYNHSFYPNNGQFYCSQYIAEILPIFDIVPMKFGDGKKRFLITGRNIMRNLEYRFQLDSREQTQVSLQSPKNLSTLGNSIIKETQNERTYID